MTTIVYQGEAEIVVAMSAHCGLDYVAPVDDHGRREGARDAFKERLSHFRQDIRCSNDHSGNRDQSIYVLWIQETHTRGPRDVIVTHLNRVFQCRPGELLKEDFVRG